MLSVGSCVLSRWCLSRRKCSAWEINAHLYLVHRAAACRLADDICEITIHLAVTTVTDGPLALPSSPVVDLTPLSSGARSSQFKLSATAIGYVYLQFFSVYY